MLISLTELYNVIYIINTKLKQISVCFSEA